jgi:DNA polymerase (family X)
MGPPRRHTDVNAVVGGYLRDLAFAQPTQPQMFGYKRAHGLKIAGGMSMTEAVDQRRAIDRINDAIDERFRLLQGIEANIDADGRLDLSADEATLFDIVLAAPHSRLRRAEDQTKRSYDRTAGVR